MPCGPIYSIDQVFADAHVQQLGVTEIVESGALGALKVTAQPVKLARTPSHIAAAAPELGEHSDEILASIGYSAAEIADFKKRNIV